MSLYTLFINRTIIEEVSWFREGNHQVWRGIQSSFVVCPWVFFYDQHTPYNAPLSNLALFQANLLYLGSYVHFLGINAHNSISHNRSMKKCTKTVWKIMLLVFTKFACLLRGMGRDFEDMCGKSQPQTCRLLVFWLYKIEKHAWKIWYLAWCHCMTSTKHGKFWRGFG